VWTTDSSLPVTYKPHRYSSRPDDHPQINNDLETICGLGESIETTRYNQTQRKRFDENCPLKIHTRWYDMRFHYIGSDTVPKTCYVVVHSQALLSS
jgi:hypothetical protein